jgi:hypothetical protein
MGIAHRHHRERFLLSMVGRTTITLTNNAVFEASESGVVPPHSESRSLAVTALILTTGIYIGIFLLTKSANYAIKYIQVSK